MKFYTLEINEKFVKTDLAMHSQNFFSDAVPWLHKFNLEIHLHLYRSMR
jgi:hypothetical protein